MFGKIHNLQKQDEQPADPNVRAENPAVQQIQPEGNEGANAFTQMLKEANAGTGNDFLAGLMEEARDLPGGEDGKEGAAPGSGLPEEPKKDAGENIADDCPKNEEPKKDAGAQPKAEDVKKVIEDIFPDRMEEIEDFYKDPEPVKQEEEEDVLNESMIVHAPKKHNVKRKKKKNDIKKAAAPMERIKGLNVAVQKLPERKKAGWWSRFLTGTAWYAGKTLGKAINWLANLVIMPFFGKEKKKRAFSKSTENPLITQEKRTHDLIPGWEGEKYEKEPDREDNILADFRRVPTVWSYLTAGQGQDDEGKPLPPKVSVNVNQPEPGEDKDVSLSGSGHAGIGIEYSRYSRVSNRYERYGLKYGFYMADATASAGILNGAQDAMTFGQLRDEKGVDYDVTRTFPASSKQVNDILKASETWADGGYNNLTRNCTTFVKTMVSDVAHLPVGKQIFQKRVPDLNSAANFFGFAAAASTANAKIGMESSFEKLAAQDDTSYAGLGNKRAVGQDYKQYKESMDHDATWKKRVDLPNSAAENMRRMEGPDSGIISSGNYTSEKLKDPANKKKLIKSFYNYEQAIKDERKKVKEAILKLAGKNNEEELFAMPGLPGNMSALIAGLDFIHTPLEDLALEGVDNAEGIENPILNKNYFIDPEALRKGRAQIEESIVQMNTLLFTFFKNDKRLHMPFMKLLSVLQQSMDYIDLVYGSSKLGEKNTGGDLGDIRSDMNTQVIAETSVRQPGEEEEKQVSNMITPSHYESYIQIYKTPDEAMKNYSRYIELQGKRNRTKAEEKEFRKRERMETLAEQFDNAHRYMLEKNAYSQQDVDYAFSLSKKERESGVTGSINKNSSSGIYQSLIFEKIFGGMKQRFKNHITTTADAKDPDLVRNWLDNDLHECISRKKDEMKTVIRAIKRSENAEDEAVVLIHLSDAVKMRWLYPVFIETKSFDRKIDAAKDNITDAWNTLILDNTSKTGTAIDSLVKSVMEEDNLIHT